MASRKDDFMGGLFDFNGDGKTDLGEEFIAYQIFEDMTNNQKSSEHKTNYVSTLPTNDSGIDNAIPNQYDVNAKPDTIDIGHNKKPEHKKDARKMLLACVVLSFLVIAIIITVNKINDRPYQEALKLFGEDKYQESLVALQNLWVNGSKDVIPLTDAIRAFREYDAGNVEEAYRYLNQWSTAYKRNAARYLPAQYKEKIDAFQTRVKKEYDAIKEEQQKEQAYQAYLQRKQFEQEMAEAKEKLKDQFPYIGMDERFVSLTALGDYSYYSIIDKNDHPYHVYIFKDGKGRETYAVTCKNNVVTSVWDKLNERKLTENNRWKTRPKSNTVSPDPYNAKDYSNEEDFYDDHWADFFDYFEAEEYWQEHQ